MCVLVVCVRVYVESKSEHQISFSVSLHLISRAEPESGGAGFSVSSRDLPVSLLPSLGPQVCTHDFCINALDPNSGAHACACGKCFIKGVTSPRDPSTLLVAHLQNPLG